MKNKGFGHLKTRLCTIKTSKHLGVGAHGIHAKLKGITLAPPENSQVFFGHCHPGCLNYTPGSSNIAGWKMDLKNGGNSSLLCWYTRGYPSWFSWPKKRKTLRISDWTLEKKRVWMCFWQGSGISSPHQWLVPWFLGQHFFLGDPGGDRHPRSDIVKMGFVTSHLHPSTWKTAVAVNFHQLVALKPSTPVA